MPGVKLFRALVDKGGCVVYNKAIVIRRIKCPIYVGMVFIIPMDA